VILDPKLQRLQFVIRGVKTGLWISYKDMDEIRQNSMANNSA